MERTENKAYEFKIEWKEIADLIKKEFNIDDIDFVDYIDLKTNEKFLNILTNVFNSRNNEVITKRGDILYLLFINHDQAGRFFYNGEKIIPPGLRDTIPIEFKVPEFPPDYWDETGFMDYIPNCLNFDIDKNTKLKFIKEVVIKSIYGGLEYCGIYQESKYNYYIIFLYNYDSLLETFKKNGLCTYVSDKNLIKYNKNKFLEDKNTSFYVSSQDLLYTNLVKFYNEIKEYVNIEKTLFVLSIK